MTSLFAGVGFTNSEGPSRRKLKLDWGKEIPSNTTQSSLCDNCKSKHLFANCLKSRVISICFSHFHNFLYYSLLDDIASSVSSWYYQFFSVSSNLYKKKANGQENHQWIVKLYHEWYRRWVTRKSMLNCTWSDKNGCQFPRISESLFRECCNYVRDTAIGEIANFEVFL